MAGLQALMPGLVAEGGPAGQVCWHRGWGLCGSELESQLLQTCEVQKQWRPQFGPLDLPAALRGVSNMDMIGQRLYTGRRALSRVPCVGGGR